VLFAWVPDGIIPVHPIRESAPKNRCIQGTP
jgi:hypothetical protein